MIAAGLGLSLRCSPLHPALCARRPELGSSALTGTRLVGDGKGDSRKVGRSSVALRPIMAMEEHQVWVGRVEESVAAGGGVQGLQDRQLGPVVSPVVGECDCATDGAADAAATGVDHPVLSTVGKSTNILWHDCPVGQLERQKLLGQRGCVIWITGLSGSGKSTLACALSRELYCRGYLSYVLDGDNVRHGLNKDLSFKPEDRAENIRRIGEVAKLFADAGVICIASLISPYRRDRDACRALLPEPNFIEVFMDMPLEVCEARDPKGLYKLARAGKIKGFTGIDDPYERPLNCEIAIQQKDGLCPSPIAMVEQVMLYLELNGYLQAEFDL